MSNVIEFKNKDDIEYITGDYNEPDIVGIKTPSCSIQYAPDLHGVLVGDYWIKRDHLIAFILATDIWHDIDKIIKDCEQ